MATPRYDNKSCLDKWNKMMIRECDICSKCREIKGLSKHKLTKEKKKWTGICETLQNGIQALQVYQEEQDEENTTFCRPRRSSASKIDRFVSEPTAKMRSSYLKPTQKRPKKERPPLQELSGNQLCKMIEKDPRLRKEFFQAVAKNPNLCLPRDGQSKAAKSRRKKATQQVAFAAMKSVQEPHLPSAEKERRVIEALGGDTKTLAEIFEEAKNEARASEQDTNGSSIAEARTEEGATNERNETTAGVLGSTETTARTKPLSRKKRGKKESKKERFARQVREVKEALGTELIHQISEMEEPRFARPLLALVGRHKGVSRQAVIEATGKKISKQEWNNVQIHSKWPGPLKPVKKKVIERNRIKTEHLLSLLRFLAAPERSQRYAFGNKLLALAKDFETRMIDNVSLRSTVDDVVSEYLQELTEEMEKTMLDPDQCPDQKIPQDEERCTCCQKVGAKWRCLKTKDHKGRCQFTPKGGMSYATCLALAKTLTGNEIKKLAGLDDVKVLKGRNNWERARDLIDALYPDHADNEKRKELRVRIDKQETFYVTDYIPHLSRESNHKCNCLTCGFCEEGSDICCPKRDQHGPSCTRCSDGFAVFHELQAKAAEKEAELKNCPQTKPIDLQNLYQLKADVESCIEDLLAYRGHLARHTAEEEYAMWEYNELADDIAIVTSDYKMKILANYFRENQNLWFGKRGTTCLGFMIVTNPKDDEARKQGIKDVKFVMMITPDGLQDDWAVACAKAYVYENCLPPQIKKVIFCADGAGCFKSKLHRAIQGFWEYWTKIEETQFRLSPAGDGKTELDGMFGRMSCVLDSSIVKSNSHYHDWKTILEVLGDSNGLAATHFVGYEPNRTLQLAVETEKSFSSSFLTSFKQSDCLSRSKMLSKLFKHTGYGSGDAFSCSDFQFFLKNSDDDEEDAENTTSSKKKKSPKTFIEFYDQETGLLDLEVLEKYKPSWIGDIVNTRNKKENVPSVVSRRGEGKNSKEGREKKRQKRIQARSEKRVEAALQDIEDMRAAGLFPCGARCPKTGHFCRKTFLTEFYLKEHRKKAKCDFPCMNARTFIIYNASKTGGAFENGSNAQRTRSKKLHEGIVAAAENTQAELAARCYQCFNRSDTTKPEHLTDGQLAFLLRMYGSASKKNSKEIHELMKVEIDPVDGGLMFCPQKARMETNGSLLAESKITSWLSSECANRKNKKKPSGSKRVESLLKHLEEVKKHKRNKPTNYWKVRDEKGKEIVKSELLGHILPVVGIRGVSKMKKTERMKVISDMNLDQDSFDEKLVEARRRIDMLTAAIEVSNKY